MAKRPPRKKPVGKQRELDGRRQLGLGLVFKPGPPPELLVTGFQRFRVAMGDDLLIAFCRGFSLLYRLASVVDLMGLNYKIADSEPVRHTRNFQTLGLFACGLAHELPNVFYDLRRASVETFLSAEGKKRWARLARFERLSERKIIKKVRDELAFHAGEPKTMALGLERLTAKPRPVSLYTSDAGKRPQQTFGLGLEVMFAALAIDLKSELRPAYTEVRDANVSMLRALGEVFLDVLRAKGADLNPLPPERSALHVSD